MDRIWRGCFFAWMVALVAVGCGGSDEKDEDVSTADVEETTSCIVDENCGEGLICHPEDFLCVVCVPGTTRCEDGGMATCQPDGVGYGIPLPCEDGDPCTIGDECIDGECQTPIFNECNDDDSCTDDYCVPHTGECTHFLNNTPGCCASDGECDDGLGCTTETCEPTSGSCTISGGPCADLVHNWGEKGSGAGQISGPRGIAVLPNGNVVISDTINNRMALFTAEGESIGYFGSGETEDGGVNQPSGVTVFPDGRIAVADTGNDRITIYDMEGSYILSLDGDPGDDTILDGPADVGVTPDGGAVWVANSSKDNIVKISILNELLKTWGETGDKDGNFRSPRGIFVDKNEKLYVTDSEIARVQVLDPDSGELIIKFGVEGSATGEFQYPAGVALTYTGHMVVADPGNERLQFFYSCVPNCGDDIVCGSNGCGGTCGGCAPEDTAQCVGGVCTGGLPGEEGCNESNHGGCSGCECEVCTCEEDSFCCETSWDNLCVEVCASCGFVCNVGTAQLEPVVNYKSELSGPFLSPTQVFITDENVLWVVDNITSGVLAYDLSY